MKDTMLSSYDMVVLGEPLLRFSPPDKGLLRAATSLNVHVAGAQYNVASNFARLGKRSALLTKLPDNPLGTLVLDACRRNGVDVSQIQLLADGKMGTTYVEFSVSPRVPHAVYDRVGSAASTITPCDFDWDAVLGKSVCAYTDGIFAALSPSCEQAACTFLRSARNHGCMTCFDLNYREHLWSLKSARECFTQLLPLVDVLATNRDASENILDFHGSDEQIMRQYLDAFGCRIVTLTHRTMNGLDRGGWCAQAIADGKYYAGRCVEFDVVDRYGTGDAYFSGFLYGCLAKDAVYGLDFGTGMCALAHTIMGDVAGLTPEDVAAVMTDRIDLRVRR